MGGDSFLHDTTRSLGHDTLEQARPWVPTLTIAHHPDSDRVGQRVCLLELLSGERTALSRLSPRFSWPGETHGDPLADPFVSRSPVWLRCSVGNGVELDPVDSGQRVVADGVAIDEPHRFSSEDLARGVVLELSKRVVLVLHHLRHPIERAPSRFGLVGDSEAIETLRGNIARVAELSVPVLLRGETGTGKELVAEAIHQNSSKSGGPCVCVNMGAIPATVAASELFGHVKGAFTGAAQNRQGHFVLADGGTLFLDEIGETPSDVQPLLLRALETFEIQQLGASATRKVDVRLIAATDANLEEAVGDGSFRQALLHRLSGYVISVPALRERRDDIGRLFMHFVRMELDEVGEPHRLQAAPPNRRPWLPTRLLARLCAYDWPGNVRQVRNVARQIVISSRGADQVRIDPALEALLPGLGSPTSPRSSQLASAPSSEPSVAVAAPRGDAPPGLSAEEMAERKRIMDALAATQNNQTRAAKDLGISRRWLITKMERYNIPRPRKKPTE